jgi:succinate dehydrogenase flavin-adding protein (antitoxin of CptAB toxin-antitoxin module)
MKPAKTAISIRAKSSATGISKGQKLFNKLIKQIEQQRQHLQTLHQAMPLYQQKHASQYQPAMQAFDQLRTRLVIFMDKAHREKKLTNTERLKLADLISSICGELLARESTPELREIFDRHNEVGFDEQEEEGKAMLKIMLEDMMGMPIEGELDLRDPESIMRMMAEKAGEAKAQYQAEQELKAAKAANKKKSAKQLAKEEKLAEDEKKVSQSIREVYRKLASELHPDREPDETERQRKTDLMQRVNVAYDKQDLLGLLELQLEIEQIDQHAIAAISDEKLKHYNQILREQAQELEMEIAGTEFRFRMQYPNLEDGPLYPDTLLEELDEEIGDLHSARQMLEDDLNSFEEVKNLKAFLKSYRLPPKNPFAFDGF